MSITIADRLRYLLTTKSHIKDAIKNRGVEVADSDSFRSYADKIKSIKTADDVVGYILPSGYAFNKVRTTNNLVLTDWDTSHVKSMANAFANCSQLVTLDVSNWDLSKVFSIQSFVQYCSNLTSVDCSNWNTKSVVNFMGAFSGCPKLETITGLSDFDTSSCTNMYALFRNSAKLNNYDLSKWDTSKVENMAEMFKGNTGLTTHKLAVWSMASCKTLASMYQGCTALTASNFTSTRNAPHLTTMKGMYQGCSALTSINLTGIKAPNCTDLSYMFDGCKVLITTNGISLLLHDNIQTVAYMFRNCLAFKGYSFQSTTTTSASKLVSVLGMFEGCSNLTGLNMETLDFSNVLDTRDMLKGCTALANMYWPKNIKVSISVATCPALTRTSLQDLFNKVATVTTSPTITLHATAYARTTAEDRKVATDKGWKVVSA